MQNKPDHFADAWDDDDHTIHTSLQHVLAPSGALERARARMLQSLVDTPPVESNSVDVSPVSVAKATEAQASVRGRRTFTRRRLASLVFAASVVAIGLFLMQRSSPLTSARLAAFCDQQLDAMLRESPEWTDTNARSQELSALLGTSSVKLELIGASQGPVGSFASACQVWKFNAADGNTLYVFDFESLANAEQIPSRLDALTGSHGTWSMAAVRQNDHVLVVAVRGNYQQYFSPARLA